MAFSINVTNTVASRSSDVVSLQVTFDFIKDSTTLSTETFKVSLPYNTPGLKNSILGQMKNNIKEWFDNTVDIKNKESNLKLNIGTEIENYVNPST